LHNTYILMIGAIKIVVNMYLILVYQKQTFHEKHIFLIMEHDGHDGL